MKAESRGQITGNLAGTLAEILAETLADMVAPTLSTQDRCSLLDHLVRDPDADAGSLEACAKALGGSGPEAYNYWIARCVRELSRTKDEAGLADLAADTAMARARLYIVWQDFCARHRDEMAQPHPTD